MSRPLEDSSSKVKKFCECGCGSEVNRRFVSGHNSKGKKLSAEHKEKIRLANLITFQSPKIREKIRLAMLGNKHTFGKRYSAETNKKKGAKGERHPRWRGDNVGYSGVHYWIKKIFPKSELCQICNKKPPSELSNISGEYLRDLKDWQWLCGSCHREFDDCLKKAWTTRKKEVSG